MFAVIKTGGKQYKVTEGSVVTVEKLNGQAGETITFDQVLMLGGDSPVIGAPTVEGAAVSGEILEQKRGPKTISYVKRRRKHSSQRRRGHRQDLTVVRILDLAGKGGDKSTSKPAEVENEGTRPNNLLEAARDGQPDDLKQISGVGPKLEELLHENGVFHFDQIAAWNSDEIAYMDNQLSFKGRIERDGWIDQASKFAAE